jgi:hypothetical protein
MTERERRALRIALEILYAGPGRIQAAAIDPDIRDEFFGDDDDLRDAAIDVVIHAIEHSGKAAEAARRPIESSV